MSEEQQSADVAVSFLRAVQQHLAPSERILTDLRTIYDLLRQTSRQGGRVLIVGNGGSAAIASHVATDMTKNAGIRSLTFSDASMISCLANDYGFENWMHHAVRLHAQWDDMLIAISSSGRSANILGAVEQAHKMDLPVVTLTGFDVDNPVRELGDANLWVDSRAYNVVETVHQTWLLCLVDMIIGKSEYLATRVAQPTLVTRTTS